MTLLALITGQLWRDPVARESKSGKQFVTATLHQRSSDVQGRRF